MPVKKLINSPIFYFIRGYFTGDNVAYYLPAKYLWTVCNVTKTGFHQPVYDFKLDGPITLDFMFYPEQPQHKYFKKPDWINEFIVAGDMVAAQQIAGHYDYCINNYRNRGAQPAELNWGYPPGMQAIELYAYPYSYKAIYEQSIYLDDLFLTDEYQEYLQSVNQAVNPDRRPVIALHHRGGDRWKRHLPNSAALSEVLLRNLLDAYPEHQIVLLGESWRYHRHPRIKYLEDSINLRNLKKRFEDYSACLQFILAAYFCRDADMVFCGISGFSAFIESIRPLDKTPPIPIFWGPKTFTGTCTFMKKMNWNCCAELADYRKAHPEDAAFLHDTPNFLYYNRNEVLLKPYCLDYPNNLDKIFTLLKQISEVKEYKIEIRTLQQGFSERLITYFWHFKSYVRLLKRLCQIIFLEKAGWGRIMLIVKELMTK